jgi:hypothetical protein
MHISFPATVLNCDCNVQDGSTLAIFYINWTSVIYQSSGPIFQLLQVPLSFILPKIVEDRIAVSVKGIGVSPSSDEQVRKIY